MKVNKGDLFKALEPADEDNPQYDHYLVMVTGTLYVVDCYPCDARGNHHPDFDVSPIPVRPDDAFGEFVGNFNDPDSML